MRWWLPLLLLVTFAVVLATRSRPPFRPVPPEVRETPATSTAAPAPDSPLAPPPAAVPAPDDIPVEIEERPTWFALDFAGTIETAGEGAGADGYIEIREEGGRWHSVQRVNVQDGRFQTEIGEDTQKLEVTGIHLDGKEAILEDEVTLTVPLRGPVTLAARRRLPRTLVVRDAVTGQELRNVEVFLRVESGGQEHPGSAPAGKRLVGPTGSPVVIPNVLPSLRHVRDGSALLVHSPGHAFSRVELAPRGEGALDVQLEPGGSLRVDLTGAAQDPRTVLRVRRAGERIPLVEEQTASRKHIKIPDLPRGEYRVTAEIGRRYRDCLVLAEEEVRLSTGERAAASLELKAPPKVSLAPLAGVVVLPAAWGDAAPGTAWLRFEGIALGESEDLIYLREDDFTAEGFGVFSFDAGMVQAGSWKFDLQSPWWSTSFSIHESNGGRVRIEVPPPGTAKVRVLSDATAEPVPMDLLRWNRVGGNGSGIADQTGVGLFEFRAPAGRVRIESTDQARLWLAPEVEIDLRPGDNEVTLTATRVCLVELTVRTVGRFSGYSGRDELVEISLPDGVPLESIYWEMAPRIIYSDGVSEGGRSDRYRYCLRRAGRYRFHVPVPAGFTPVPDVEVEAVIGTAIRHTVELHDRASSSR